ncbi:MAG: hypothetical protein BWZ10_01405 [candidate division BRC1 bacterium ADurb.BinA364]|nr:MAG: hypothetical protein BWZ10_01405 [candidate division BRC1 bacterium ADurb.BinA364]
MCFRLAGALVFAFAATVAFAAEYYVSEAGSDDGPGSLDKPFRTIQRAAEKMEPGDVCLVRGGIYRETVRPPRGGEPGKPIRFRAYPGETVTLSGLEAVPGPWTLHRGRIYKTALAEPVEQLFADDKMLIEARWPNMRFEEIWDRAKWARSAEGSHKDLMICPALADTGIDWTGALATLNVGHQYRTWTRRVLSHQAGSDRFSYALEERLGDGKEDGPTWGDDCFYLSGKLEALDSPTEWFHDPASQTLYVWLDGGGDPAANRIERKARDFAFDANAISHIEIEGFPFFATAFRFLNCTNCLAENCLLYYPSYSRELGETNPAASARATAGALMHGDDNTIRRCGLAYSPSHGLAAVGRNNLIENCIVHDANWLGSITYPAIRVSGDADGECGSIVRRCTVEAAGNIGIGYRSKNIVIEYNDVSHTGRACRDIAAVHTGSPLAEGSVARYNWIHESAGIGLRGDDQTRGLTVHHNVIWNCRLRGMIVKGDFNAVFNNTVLTPPQADFRTGSLTIPKEPEPKKWWTLVPTLESQNDRSIVMNNASWLLADREHRPIAESDLVSHNFTFSADASPESLLVRANQAALDRNEADFRPRPDSPLAGAGRPVPGHEALAGAGKPSIGAFEPGDAPWRPGADWAMPDDRVRFVVQLEQPEYNTQEIPRKPGSVALPRTLLESGLDRQTLIRLQAIYDELWSEEDLKARREAIRRRSEAEEGSEDWRRQDEIVKILHGKAMEKFEPAMKQALATIAD